MGHIGLVRPRGGDPPAPACARPPAPPGTVRGEPEYPEEPRGIVCAPRVGPGGGGPEQCQPEGERVGAGGGGQLAHEALVDEDVARVLPRPPLAPRDLRVDRRIAIPECRREHSRIVVGTQLARVTPPAVWRRAI